VTCIVGIVDDGIVYIGGDRGASDGSAIISLDTPKVYIRDEWIFGYAGSLGIGQIMQIINIPLLEEDDDPFIILRMDIVEAFKAMMDAQGITINEDNNTDILIGCRGRLFEFSPSDWSVAEIKQTAIGSGGNFALGSLHTSIDADPIDRIGIALGAAITYSPSCQGPIDILYI
jgi:ATP-dependent protease HslVU (ClpYQ) peptidase subunit